MANWWTNSQKTLKKAEVRYDFYFKLFFPYVLSGKPFFSRTSRGDRDLEKEGWRCKLNVEMRHLLWENDMHIIIDTFYFLGNDSQLLANKFFFPKMPGGEAYKLGTYNNALLNVSLFTYQMHLTYSNCCTLAFIGAGKIDFLGLILQLLILIKAPHCGLPPGEM